MVPCTLPTARKGSTGLVLATTQENPLLLKEAAGYAEQGKEVLSLCIPDVVTSVPLSG